jgi:hypothetical protein
LEVSREKLAVACRWRGIDDLGTIGGDQYNSGRDPSEVEPNGIRRTYEPVPT